MTEIQKYCFCYKPKCGWQGSTRDILHCPECGSITWYTDALLTGCMTTFSDGRNLIIRNRINHHYEVIIQKADIEELLHFINTMMINKKDLEKQFLISAYALLNSLKKKETEHTAKQLETLPSPQEREFYLQTAKKERYSVRELERAMKSSLFERTIAASPKLSTSLRQFHKNSEKVFRDSYSLDFLGLPDRYSETDLRKAIVRSLKNFIIEFGRDFAFIGEEYRVQVGMKDFFLDLLFYHRELRCLVAFELKIDEFKPEHLGKISFYLEALDRDIKKPHENPSIGIILCKGKDNEVVEYALSRTLSPAAIADYTTKLPDKQLLQQKLHEFFDSSVRELQAEYQG